MVAEALFTATPKASNSPGALVVVVVGDGVVLLGVLRVVILVGLAAVVVGFVVSVVVVVEVVVVVVVVVMDVDPCLIMGKISTVKKFIVGSVGIGPVGISADRAPGTIMGNLVTVLIFASS